MAVSNDHVAKTVRVWDGVTFQMMSTEKAQKLEAEGKVQIATDLQAKDLKTVEEMKPASKKKPPTKAQSKEMKASEAMAMPPGVEPPPESTKTRKKRAYQTREMKAEK